MNDNRENSVTAIACLEHTWKMFYGTWGPILLLGKGDNSSQQVSMYFVQKYAIENKKKVRNILTWS